MKLRMSVKELKCETCGVPVTEDTAYTRSINGETHYFCCSHCADRYEGK